MKRLLAQLTVVALISGGASAQMQQNVAKGFSVDKSYYIDDFDSINTFNGNLGVTLPIGPRWTVSSSLSYQLALTYGGNVWKFWTEEDWYTDLAADPPGSRTQIWVEHANLGTFTTSRVVRNVNAGLGWNLTLGYLETGGDGGTMPYISPDGARHVFYDKLNEGETSVGALYTRDGSYLRYKLVDGLVQIEFPDGSYHRFNATTGRIASMHDRFGNTVTIDYAPGSTCAVDASECADDWTISDGFRTHVVDMKRLSPGGTPAGDDATYSFDVVKTVTFADGTAAESVYEFLYAGNDTLVGVSRQVAEKQDCRLFPVVLAAVLEGVKLPDGTKYEITTDRGDAAVEDGRWQGKFASVDGSGGGVVQQECESPVVVSSTPSVSGHLLKIKRPTGAITEWTYGRYGFPPFVPHDNPCFLKTPLQCPLMVSSRAAVGVKERIVRNRASGEIALSKRTYEQLIIPDHTATRATKVSTYDGSAVVSSSVHYYSTHFTAGDTLKSDYGLPFTESTDEVPSTETLNTNTGNADAAGRHLSTKVLDGDGNVLRYSYVRYEADPAPYLDKDESSVNRRVVSERTVHLDSQGNVSSEISTDYSDFDGLGHFRTTTTQSTSRSPAPAVERTVTTKYNAPDADVDPNAWTSGQYPGSFVQVPYDDASVKWILNTYSSRTVTEGGKSHKTLFSFDPASGFLERRRILEDTALQPSVGSNDVVTAFTESGGNVTSEAWYGGDIGADGHAAAIGTTKLSDLTLTNPTYTINHTWTFGMLSASKYSSALFNSVDRDIASATGLPGSSTDPSGLVTKYEYDTSGRLVWSIAPDGVHPAVPEELYTEYVYSTPATANATVTIRQRNGSKTSSILRTAIVEYDDLGRVTSERQRMPDGSWSLRQTLYDGPGRVQSVSEWVDENLAETSRPKTTYTYDPLGRVLTATAPDGSVVSNAYTGVWKTERTVKISTAAGPETDATTTELTDDLGRLYQVIEPGGTVTSYTYDPAGLLATVDMTDGSDTQTREFNHDGRGFLVSEDHPESAATTYEYDAKGHTRKRTIGSAVVTFAYDAAERLTTVTSGSRTLKEFKFDRPNSGSGALKDWSNGRIDEAIRHNHDIPGGDLTVTEKWYYVHPAGRVSKKETILSTGEQLEEQYSYDRLGAPVTVAYPSCISGCTSFTAPARTVTNVWSRGLLSAVSGYGNIAYADNGMVASVTHINASGNAGTIDAYDLDPSGMARPSLITFSGFCNDLVVQPLTSKSVTSGNPAALVATATGATTWLWFEVAIDGAITALTDQTTSTLTVPITSERTFFVRAGNGTCSVDSTTATVTPTAACQPPSSTITVSQNIIERNGATITASVPPAASYVWGIEGGAFVDGYTTQQVEFFAYCDAAEVVLTVQVGGCNTHREGSKTIPTTPATTAVLSTDDSSPIAQGESKLIHVTLTGAAPWTLTWSPTAPTCATTSASFDCTATPAVTTTYTLTATDTYGCTAASAPLTVTVAPPAPQNLVATATSATQVALAWTFGGSSVDMYEIQRLRAGSGWEIDGTVVGATTTTRTATAGAAYLYRVRAVKSSTPSAWSNVDLATTVIFTDDPLIPGETFVSAQHITQLRTAANAVRALASLSPSTFTDPTLTGIAAKAVHLQEVRTALDAARSALGVSAIQYTIDLAASKPIRAIFVSELRGGVK